MFYILFGILVVLTIFNYNKQSMKSIYLGIIFISGALFFSYGIGSDYFSYESIYNIVNNFGFLESAIKIPRVEIGFLWILNVFSYFNISYWITHFILSFTIFFFLYLWIKDNSKNILFSLLILVSFFFYSWVLSGLRQGLVMSIGLYLLINPRKNFSLISKICIIGLLALIHSYSFIFVITLFDLENYYIKKISLMVAISGVVVSLISPSVFNEIINQIPLIKSMNINFIDVKLFSIPVIIRLFFGLLFYYAYFNTNLDKDTKYFINFYFIGLSFYFITLPISFPPGRIFALFYLMILVVLPNILNIDVFRAKKVIVALGMCFLFVFFIKESSTYVTQSGLDTDKIGFNIPTIFSMEEYRFDQHNFYIMQQYKNDKKDTSQFGSTIMEKILNPILQNNEDGYVAWYTPYLDKKIILNQNGSIVNPKGISNIHEIYDNVIQTRTNVDGFYIDNYYTMDSYSEISYDEAINFINKDYESGRVNSIFKEISKEEIHSSFFDLFDFSGSLTEFELLKIAGEYNYNVLKFKNYGHTYYSILNVDNKPIFDEVFTEISPIDSNGFIRTKTLAGTSLYHINNGIIWMNMEFNFIERY